MLLVDHISVIRDRILADLDYYTHTKGVWRLVVKLADSGRDFTIRNMVTGSKIDAAGLAAKARGYVAEQLVEATFQQFIAILEIFIFEILETWLMAYSGSLRKKTLTFGDILDAPDKDAIARSVVRGEMRGLTCKAPSDWFAYLHEIVKIKCPSADEIGRIAEAKATRDLLVHNRGIVNQTYLDKAGSFARFDIGERIGLPDQYHRETWELIRKVVLDISAAAIDKAR